MTTQTDLNDYFSTTWHRRNSGLDHYTYTGWALVDKIQPGESVIDVGCGANLFKGRIPRILGIDPAFEQADIKTTIEEFTTSEKFDVAFCLGSINFGTQETIEKQIAKVVSLLTPKSRIYWRCNPGLKDHGNKECEAIDFYPWTFEEHHRLAKMFNYCVNDLCWDTKNRIYAVWESA